MTDFKAFEDDYIFQGHYEWTVDGFPGVHLVKVSFSSDVGSMTRVEIECATAPPTLFAERRGKYRVARIH